MPSQAVQIIEYIVKNVFQKPENTRQLIDEIATDLNFGGNRGSLQSKVCALLKKPDKIKNLHINQVIQAMFIVNFSAVGHSWNMISRAGNFEITSGGKISSFESHDGSMKCENGAVIVAESNPRSRMRAPDQKPSSEYQSFHFGGRKPTLKIYGFNKKGEESIKNSAKDFLYFLHGSVNRLTLPIFDSLLEEIELEYEKLKWSNKTVDLSELRAIALKLLGDATKNARQKKDGEEKKEKEKEDEEKGMTVSLDDFWSLLIGCLNGTDELEDIVTDLLEKKYADDNENNDDTIDIGVLVNAVEVLLNVYI